MIIALDYDKTFTADKDSWKLFLDIFQARGHTIYIVTMRSEEFDWHSDFEMLEKDYGVQTVFCDGKSKREVTEEQGIGIDIWIDDTPKGVDSDSPFTAFELQEWREKQVA